MDYFILLRFLRMNNYIKSEKKNKKNESEQQSSLSIMIHTKTEERTISMLKRFYNISIRTNTIGNLRRFNSGTMAEAQDNNTGPSFPITQIINEKLTNFFEPTHLEIINESFKHNVPKNSETHFKVVVVSTKFEDMKLIERHRTVNTILKDELKTGGVHALSIKAKTPEQWSKNNHVEPSPNCLGGSKK